MTNIPSDLRYARTHEWVRASGDTATVGITDHAQHELTDVVFVELPAVGGLVKAGEACAVVESVKTASDIYSPVRDRSSRSTRPRWTIRRGSTASLTAAVGFTKSS